MILRKAGVALRAAVLGTVLVVAGLQAPAAADVPLSGQLVMEGDLAGVGSGNYSVDTAKDTLSLTVYANTMADGKCLTVYVDVTRAIGVGGEGDHYDMRAVRTCRSNSSRSSGLLREGKREKIDITGINKLSICYGPLNQTGTCHHYKNWLQGVNPKFSRNNKCVRAWTMAKNGRTFYFDGGKSKDCEC